MGGFRPPVNACRGKVCSGLAMATCVQEATVRRVEGCSRLVDHLAHVDVLGAEARFAIVEIELPQLLEAVVEAERHDLVP